MMHKTAIPFSTARWVGAERAPIGDGPEGHLRATVHDKIWTRITSRAVVSLMALVLAGLASPAMAAQDLYFAGASGLNRANLLAGGMEEPIPSETAPGAIALDFDSGILYWLDPAEACIRRAPAAGGPIETVLSNLNAPEGLALDTAQDRLFWSAPGGIRTAPLGGGAIEDVVVGLQRPAGVAYDPAKGILYWADRDAGLIGYAAAGSGLIETLAPNLVQPGALALDLEGGYCYWTESGAARIRRIALNGEGGIEEVVLTGGQAAPLRFALDVNDGEVFWSSASGLFGAPLGESSIALLVPSPAGPAMLAVEDTVPDQNVGVWVDFQASPPFYGTFPWPHHSLAAGVHAAVSGGKVRLLYGSSNERLRIVRALRLIAFGGPVRIGAEP